MSIIGVALMLGILGIGTAFAVNLVKLSVLAHTNRQLERQKAELERKRDALRSKIDWANTPAGKEAIARNQGLVKPGEHAFRVEIVQPPAPVPAAAPLHPRHRALAFWAILAGAFVLGVIGLLVWLKRPRKRRRPDGTLTPRTELVGR
jgi:cell division protein FtsB